MFAFSNVSLPIHHLSNESLQFYEKETCGFLDHRLERRIDCIRERLLDCSRKEYEKFENQNFSAQQYIQFFKILPDHTGAMHLFGRRLQVEQADCFCQAICPFDCKEGGRYTYRYKIKDKENDRTYSFSGVVPHLITSHGFFGEKGTEHYLDPKVLFPLFEGCEKNKESNRIKNSFRISAERQQQVQACNKNRAKKKAQVKKSRKISSEEKLHAWSQSASDDDRL